MVVASIIRVRVSEAAYHVQQLKQQVSLQLPCSPPACREMNSWCIVSATCLSPIWTKALTSVSQVASACIAQSEIILSLFSSGV